jgi:hypothetical protein
VAHAALRILVWEDTQAQGLKKKRSLVQTSQLPHVAEEGTASSPITWAEEISAGSAVEVRGA